MKAVSPTVLQQQETLAPYGTARMSKAGAKQRQTQRQDNSTVHGVDLVSWLPVHLIAVVGNTLASFCAAAQLSSATN